jgi:hypothetical protein
MFEVVRVAYLLANGVCVVSETGSDTEHEARFVEGVAFAPYPELVDTCRTLLAEPARRAAIAARGRDLAAGLSLLPGLQAATATIKAA